jgi:hypothetical protein
MLFHWLFPAIHGYRLHRDPDWGQCDTRRIGKFM